MSLPPTPDSTTGPPGLCDSYIPRFGRIAEWNALYEGPSWRPSTQPNESDMQRRHFNGLWVPVVGLKAPVDSKLDIVMVVDTVKGMLQWLRQNWIWVLLRLRLNMLINLRARFVNWRVRASQERARALEAMLWYWQTMEDKKRHHLRQAMQRSGVQHADKTHTLATSYTACRVAPAIKESVVWQLYWTLKGQHSHHLRLWRKQVARARRERDAAAQLHPLTLGTADFQKRAVANAKLFILLLQQPQFHFTPGGSVRLADLEHVASTGVRPDTGTFLSTFALAFKGTGLCTAPQWLEQAGLSRKRPLVPPMRWRAEAAPAPAPAPHPHAPPDEDLLCDDIEDAEEPGDAVPEFCAFIRPPSALNSVSPTDPQASEALNPQSESPEGTCSPTSAGRPSTRLSQTSAVYPLRPSRSHSRSSGESPRLASRSRSPADSSSRSRSSAESPRCPSRSPPRSPQDRSSSGSHSASESPPRSPRSRSHSSTDSPRHRSRSRSSSTARGPRDKDAPDKTPLDVCGHSGQHLEPAPMFALAPRAATLDSVDLTYHERHPLSSRDLRARKPGSRGPQLRLRSPHGPGPEPEPRHRAGPPAEGSLRSLSPVDVNAARTWHPLSPRQTRLLSPGSPCSKGKPTAPLPGLPHTPVAMPLASDGSFDSAVDPMNLSYTSQQSLSWSWAGGGVGANQSGASFCEGEDAEERPPPAPCAAGVRLAPVHGPQAPALRTGPCCPLSPLSPLGSVSPRGMLGAAGTSGLGAGI